MTIQRFFNLSIEKTFLIASLPFIGYLLAYAFQSAFYNYYDIPILLIQVSIESIIYALIPLFALTGFIMATIAWLSNTNEISVNSSNRVGKKATLLRIDYFRNHSL
jgi:hypothetical protein